MPTSASHQLQGLTLWVPTNRGNLHFWNTEKKTEEHYLNIYYVPAVLQGSVMQSLLPSFQTETILYPCPHSADGKMEAQRRELCWRSHIHNQGRWTWTQVFKAAVFLFQNAINLIPVPSSNSPKQQPYPGLFGVLQFGSMKEITAW